MERITMPAKPARKAKKEQHLHSRNHVLADELSQRFGEPKRFGFYLRMATKYNHDFLRRIAGEVAEKDTVKNPGAMFAYLVKSQADQANAIEPKESA